jgi:alkylation response protein AidB-like acyl-CoA dehydrogenase
MTDADADRHELRAAARRFLSSQATSAQAREAMAGERGWDVATWTRMARELGWAGLAIPEAHGGAGGSFADLAVLLEETGRALACAPLFATSCLGAAAILECGDEAQAAAFLPRIASGEETATLAVTERAAGPDARDVETTALRTDNGWTLSGTKRYVVDGHTADRVVVVARDEGTSGEEGLALFVVPAGARGFERRALTTMDQTRRLAEITLRHVRVPGPARLARGSWNALQRVLHRACIGIAAEQVGGAARCLEMTVEYAKARTQFGRAIGSFQAIKHKCADMLVSLESARSAMLHAARVASGPCADEELSVAASIAKAVASDAFFHCASETIQIHGGIGFTWEHDAHLFFKRARASRQLLGDPAHHRDRVARHIGLP